MRQLIAALLFFAVAASAATEREVAEWTLRWEGSLILEGSNEPIRNLSQLPPGDFHIASIDLSGAVMRKDSFKYAVPPPPMKKANPRYAKRRPISAQL